jgi:ComF family protein
MVITLQKYAHQLYLLLEYIFLPPRCWFCSEDCVSGQKLCAICYKKITPLVSYALPITKQYSVQVIALSAYVNPVRHLILAKHGMQRRASKILGGLLAERLAQYQQRYDVVVPVPLHWTRYARRGYNQATVMGSVIARAHNIECKELLVRKKMTAYQAGLAPFKRVTNMKEAFVVHAQYAELYRDKHILLIDDVMTTGVTLIEAVKQLRTLKPASITIAVAARVT